MYVQKHTGQGEMDPKGLKADGGGKPVSVAGRGEGGGLARQTQSSRPLFILANGEGDAGEGLDLPRARETTGLFFISTTGEGTWGGINCFFTNSLS